MFVRAGGLFTANETSLHNQGTTGVHILHAGILMHALRMCCTPIFIDILLIVYAVGGGGLQSIFVEVIESMIDFQCEAPLMFSCVSLPPLLVL